MRMIGATLAVVATALALLAVATPAPADPGDIGTRGASWGNLGGSAPGNKESKLWFADGAWWGDLYDGSTSEHAIHRLNRLTGTWQNVGTQLDTRRSTRSDVLWDGSANKLYVASHRYTTNASVDTSAGNGHRLYRYSYSPQTDRYSLDPGYPVTFAAHDAETLTIDKDSTGRLWASWVAGQRVWVAHSQATEASWSEPFVLPGTSSVDADDISSIIAFGDRIGVLWSDQNGGHMRFAVHADGEADDAWSRETLNTGYSPDDHISLRADTAGNVWAATKTSEGTGRPLILLSKRTPAGTWSHHPFGVAPLHTRPLILLNEPAGEVRVLATCPEEGATTAQNGGDICEKVASMANPQFSPGAGTTIMHEGTGTPDLNDVTSTKQSLTSQSGVVAVAGQDTLNFYWHSDDALGGTPPVDSVPTAGFTATPTAGTAPLRVQFTNTSTGSPAPSYTWDFGDGSGSGDTSPTHVYDTPGTYDVTLTATNAVGEDTHAAEGFVTVEAPSSGGGGGSEHAFTAVADAAVKSSSATRNYGTQTWLRTRKDTGPTGTHYRSYLKFTVSGLSGAPSSARLRLWSTDGSPDGGAVAAVSNTWTETGITWSTSPEPGTTIGTAGATEAGGFVEIPLTHAVTGNGTHSFVLTTTSHNSQLYASRESADPAPQLILTEGDGGAGEPGPGPDPVTAGFSASSTAGQGSLSVDFIDESTGGADTWSWDFGDGGSSGQQSPSHTYTTPGTYTVTLTATRSADGSADTETKVDHITVGEQPAPGETRTVGSVADAQVKNTSPTRNYGTASTLRIREGDAGNVVTYHTLLKFDVTGASGPIPGAKLRLFVIDASPDGGALYKVSDDWTETGVTWNTAPALPASSIATIGATTAGQWVEIPLGAAITGNGIYSFKIASSSTNSAIYASRDSDTPPELVLPT